MKKIKYFYFNFANIDLYKNLLPHAARYLISSVAVKAIAVISMPIMTRLLTPGDYGIYNVYLSYINIFVPLLSLNLYSALGRYYYEENADIKTFFGTSIISVLVLFCFWGGFFFIFSNFVASLLKLPIGTINFIVPSVLFYVASSWFEQIYVAQKKSTLISNRDIVRAVMMFIVGIALIFYLDKDKYLGMIYSAFIVGLVFLVYYTVNLSPYFSWNFSKKHFKYMFSYSIPLIPSSISGVVLAQFDRIMINDMIGPNETGLYSIAYNVALLLTLVITSLHLAWMPDYYDLMNKKKHEKLNKDIDRILRIIFFAAFGLICFSKELIYTLAAPKFHVAHSIVPIIVIGYIFNSFFSFYSWGITYAKRNMYLTIVTFIGGGSNVLLNYLLLPKFGYTIAAYTTTFSFAIMALCAWGINKYILKTYYFSGKSIIKQFVIFAIFVAAFYLLIGNITHVLIVFCLKVLLVATYLAIQVYLLDNDAIPA